jgi:hypothetical protein
MFMLVEEQVTRGAEPGARRVIGSRRARQIRRGWSSKRSRTQVAKKLCRRWNEPVEGSANEPARQNAYV